MASPGEIFHKNYYKIGGFIFTFLVAMAILLLLYFLPPGSGVFLNELEPLGQLLIFATLLIFVAAGPFLGTVIRKNFFTENESNTGEYLVDNPTNDKNEITPMYQKKPHYQGIIANTSKGMQIKDGHVYIQLNDIPEEEREDYVKALANLYEETLQPIYGDKYEPLTKDARRPEEMVSAYSVFVSLYNPAELLTERFNVRTVTHAEFREKFKEDLAKDHQDRVDSLKIEINKTF
jgi:hypothetical protein